MHYFHYWHCEIQIGLFTDTRFPFSDYDRGTKLQPKYVLLLIEYDNVILNPFFITGRYLQANDDGNCICSSSRIFLCNNTFIALFILLIVCTAVAVGYFFFTHGDFFSKRDKQLHQIRANELRSRLGITKIDKFVLSTERIPVWRNQNSFIILQAEYFDAAVRLDCLREDFDIKHVDGFCIALRSTSNYEKVCVWILDICRCLLNPSEQRPRLRKASSSSWSRLKSGCSNQIRDESVHTADWLQYSTQDERFDYFQNKIGRLQIMRENNNAIFERVKRIVDECMVQIGNLCIGRFVQLISEHKGHELRCLVHWQEWARTTSSSGETNQDEEGTVPSKPKRGRSGSLDSPLALVGTNLIPSASMEETASIHDQDSIIRAVSNSPPRLSVMRPACLERSYSM